MAGYKKPRKYSNLEDRAIARKIWMKQITKQNEERADRYDKFQRVIDMHKLMVMSNGGQTNQFVIEPMGSSFVHFLLNKANDVIDIEVMRTLSGDEETGVLVTLFADANFPSAIYDVYAKLNQQLVVPTITIVE